MKKSARRYYSYILPLSALILLSCITGCGTNQAVEPAAATLSKPAVQPDISEIQATGITSNSVVITWIAGKPLSGYIEWGTAKDYDFNQEVKGQPGMQQMTMLNKLKSNTLYHYRFNMSAQDGSPVTSADQTFTTLEGISGTPLTLSDIGPLRLTPTSAIIGWYSDEPAQGQAEYGKTTSYGSKSPADSSYIQYHSIELKQLSPNTEYHYRVMSQNKSGSEAVTTDQVFKTADPADKTGPVISDIQVTDITHNSATIMWTTNELATSRIEYSIDVSFSNISLSDNSTVYDHYVTLENLEKSKTYRFRIVSSDWANNTSVSADSTFVTASAPRILGPRTHRHTDCKCGRPE